MDGNQIRLLSPKAESAISREEMVYAAMNVSYS